MKHDKYKYWTQAGTISTLTDCQIDELRKNHSVEIYHRRVMIRKKPNRQLPLRQRPARLNTINYPAQQRRGLPKWVHKWIQKLLFVIILYELAMGYVTVNAKQYIGVDAKVDISPVRFTDEEIKDIFRKNPNDLPEPKHQKLWEEVQQEVKAKANLTDAQYEVVKTIEKYFGAEAERAVLCAKSESGLRTNAQNVNRNGSIDRGVFQVNSIHCGKVQGDCATALFDLETNVKVAKQIWDGRGWNAWYGSNCKQYWK